MAGKRCRSYGLELASIESAEENDTLAKALNGIKCVLLQIISIIYRLK